MQHLHRFTPTSCFLALLLAGRCVLAQTTADSGNDTESETGSVAAMDSDTAQQTDDESAPGTSGASESERASDVARENAEDVDLEGNPETPLTIDTSPAPKTPTASGGEIARFEVTAPRLAGSVAAGLDERKEASSVSEVIGSEQMSKSGDSDAASALKRVTGITIVDGKFVYIRGMGERYSSTLLNGSALPSPEPDKRVVPLDMFPAEMLESMLIQKTYSPELPGEFGGGMVLLRTRPYPKKLELKAEVSGGFGVGTTFTSGLRSADRGSTDWLGIDGGHRDLPAAVREATAKGKLVTKSRISKEGFTPEELARISAAMPNSWRMREDTLPPDLTLKLFGGDSVSFGEVTLGALIGGLYENSWDRTSRHKRKLASSDGVMGEVLDDYHFDETTNEITLGGIATVGVDLTRHHRLQNTLLVDRITDNKARVYSGYSADLTTNIKSAGFDWNERSLLSEQVVGHHDFPVLKDFAVDWRYAFSRAKQHEPDRRSTLYTEDPATSAFRLSSRDDAISRQFTEVRDKAHDLGLDLSLPFAQWTDEIAKVQVGGAVTLKDRKVDTRRFGYKDRGNLLANDPDLATLSPEKILVGSNMGLEGFMLNELTRPTDNYQGTQDLRALYGMGDVPLGLGFRLSGGARLERSTQEVTTFEIFALDKTPVMSRLKTTDVLPSATLSYSILENMLVRAGISRTVNRPDFRELSQAVFSDVIGEGEVTGNPALRRARITSYDARFEWYPHASESLSLGGFYKSFESPIETQVIPSTDTIITFVNAKGATNLGLELEVRKGFGFVADAIEDFYFAGNATWVRSNIELAPGGNETSKERPLQGQSPFIVNGQLGYDNEQSGTNASLLYNVFGARIAAVGTLGRPDTYEQPFHQLDFVAKQRLGKGFSVTVKAKNILDLPVELRQGGELIETYHRDRYFGLSVSWTH